MQRVLGIVSVQQCQVAAELYDVQKLIGVNAVTNKAVFSLGCRPGLVKAACTGFEALMLGNSYGIQQSCMGCKSS